MEKKKYDPISLSIFLSPSMRSVSVSCVRCWYGGERNVHVAYNIRSSLISVTFLLQYFIYFLYIFIYFKLFLCNAGVQNSNWESFNAGPLLYCCMLLEDATYCKSCHFTGCMFTLTRALYLLRPSPEHSCLMQSLYDILQCLKSTYGFCRMEDAQRSFMASMMQRLAADEEVHSCCSNPPVITSSYYSQSDMYYYTRLVFNHHLVTFFFFFPQPWFYNFIFTTFPNCGICHKMIYCTVLWGLS